MTKEMKFADNTQGVIKCTYSHETTNLVSVNNNQVVTTSLQIAEFFDKEHKSVLRQINLLECSDLFRQRNFAPSCYTRKNGNVTKSYPMYYITKDGFIILAMGFTGKIAAKFKEAYINAFNEMEEKLRGVTVNEKKVIETLHSLCEDIDGRIKEHDKQLQKQFKGSSNPAVISPTLFCSGSLQEQLKYIFKALGNDILAGQFAWAKLEALEKEHKKMKKSLAGMANEFLSFY